MFGTGIHTSSASSKFCPIERVAVEHVSDTRVFTSRSNDYPKNLGISSGWKDLLRNEVVVENDEGSTQDDTSPTEPPPGYDSVGVLDLFF